MGSYLTLPAEASHQRSSFAYSFSFLPRAQREALKAVYAFCRETDDLVDNDADAASKSGRLNRWREELTASLTGGAASPTLRTLASVIARFEIPPAHAFELVRGVEMDLEKDRYRTFAELKEYCYHVASSVGLMSLAIFGPRSAAAREYAVRLGIALQLTNIIRDVGADARFGRIYLPLDELERFGCPERDILERRHTPAFAALMAFQASRAREYFRLAQESLPPEDRRAMFAATIMERIYFHTLERVERSGFRVFGGPIHLPRPLQFLIAARCYLQRRLLGL
jgi:phytoene synthase